MTIYSFDGVLKTRRSMHSFEVSPMSGKRIALWRPIPYIAMIYFGVVFLLMLVADNFVPFSSIAGSALSFASGGDADIAAWVLCYALIPGCIVWLAMNAEIDGRSAHIWVASVAPFLTRHKRTQCGEPALGDGDVTRYHGKTKILWDEDAPRLQHGWVVGGRLSTTVGARFTHSLRHRHQVLKADDEFPDTHDYEVTGKLEVRP